jgi:predicted ATPase/DNA-binding CsgD family transcriptional regulator
MIPMGHFPSLLSRSYNSPNDMNSTHKFSSNLPLLRRLPIGREAETKNLQHLLQDLETRLVTITGFGGAGKTTLAIHLAGMIVAEFTGGAYFINLAALTKIEDIPLEIAHTLNVPYKAGRNILNGFKETLARRKILLILDNFEHLMGGARFVAELLETLPRLTIIATSRDPLQIRAEHVYPLPPLDTGQAVELFIQRAQTVKPDFEPAVEDSRAIAELCQRLGGLPLAVELAALRVKLFSPQAMLTRLQPDLEPASRFLSLFSASAKDLPERQQSLRKTIAWSYGLLTSEEQRALRFASVFPGGFGILTLASLLGTDEYRAIELSDSLADKHLIQKTSADDDDPRFSILEAIREFAWDEIRAQGELEDIKRRYMALYLELAYKAETHLRGAEQTVWLDAIESEYPNLMLAMEIGAAAATDSQLWQDGLWILAHLEQYWLIRALFNDLIPLSNRALGLIEQSALRDERALTLKASLLGMAGTCAWLSSNFQKAIEYHETSLSIFRDFGDESRTAFALNNKAVNLSELGDYDASLACYQESLALYEKLGDSWGQARLHWNLSNYYTFIVRDFSKVSRHNEQGLYHAKRSGDIFMLAAANLGLGEFSMLQGDYNKAQIHYEETTRLGRLYRYHQPLTNSLTGMISLALLHGDTASATEFIREGLPLAFEQMDRVMIGAYIRLSAWLASIDNQPLHIAFLAGMNEALWRDLHALDTVPDMWGGMDAAMQSARAALGEATFAQEYTHGQSLPLEESIAFVLEECLMLSAPSPTAPPISPLTEREVETLRLLTQGKTNGQISQELFVTLKTVEKHVANILRKLGVKNRTEAAAWALENGMS